MIGLTGCFASAVGAPSSAATGLNINSLITPAPKPDYSATVVEPLHRQQAAKAAEDAERDRRAAEQVKSTEVFVPTPATLPAGSHTDWMAQAGIDPSNYGYVDYIVTRESGWNPNAVNANGGACGLGQQLPCGKWAGAWNDPIAALRAMQGYVNARYGGWAGAYGYWQGHGNY